MKAVAKTGMPVGTVGQSRVTPTTRKRRCILTRRVADRLSATKFNGVRGKEAAAAIVPDQRLAGLRHADRDARGNVPARACPELDVSRGCEWTAPSACAHAAGIDCACDAVAGFNLRSRKNSVAWARLSGRLKKKPWA
jgi:hypothetical protein